MAQPIYTTLLTNNVVDPSNLTLITGSSAGKNSPSNIKQKLETADIPQEKIEKINIQAYDEVNKQNVPAADIVIFCAKPNQLNALSNYDINDGALVISIAAAKTVSDIKTALPQSANNISVIRVMPHLPKKIYGLYADNGKTNTQNNTQLCQTIMAGLGAAQILKQENDMHAYTAHAGSGPAFVAQFIASFPEEQQKTAMNILQQLASDSLQDTNHGGHAHKQIQNKCQKFYTNWLTVAKKDFAAIDEQMPKRILNATITGTINHLTRTEIPVEQFVQKVRSAKGITNAGLLYMGSKPEQPEVLEDDKQYKFGDKEQIIAQNTIASASSNNISPEDSITYALIAATNRSIGAQKNYDNPLHGVDNEAIKDQATTLLRSNANQLQR